MQRYISFFLGLSALGLGYLIARATIPVVPQSAIEVTSERIEYPKCFAGICPTYESIYPMGEKSPASAVVIPTAMTQGAGKIWIIATDENGEDKVVFKSQEQMRVGVFQSKEQIEKFNGFTIVYGTEVNNNTKGRRVEYEYIDGKFVVKSDEEFTTRE